MIKGRFLLSGTIGALLVICTTANSISDKEFISQVQAARKKQKDLLDIKGFAKTPEFLHKKMKMFLFTESAKNTHKEMRTSLSKKTQKSLRKTPKSKMQTSLSKKSKSSKGSVCLDCEEYEIPGCNCDPTCSECGVDKHWCEDDDEEPTSPLNCFVCADGSEVIHLHDLNSGDTLSQGLCGYSSTCYDDSGKKNRCECDSDCSFCYRGKDDRGKKEYICMVCKTGEFAWNSYEEHFQAMICGYDQHQK